MDDAINVLGGPLVPCSTDPLTGWMRDGCCNTDDADRGSHTVCAQVTREFLEYLAARGNDLVTPAPEHGFPGLVEGDCWCVCAASWRQAALAGKGCPVFLERTHVRALRTVPIEDLMRHAIVANEA
jgi:uncharacterized protein (DUF2237 family)